MSRDIAVLIRSVKENAASILIPVDTAELIAALVDAVRYGSLDDAAVVLAALDEGEVRIEGSSG